MNEYFKSGFEKTAGNISEGIGSVGWLPIPSAIGGLIGASKGGYKNEKALRKAEKKDFSNILLPGVGAYRMARRLQTSDKVKKRYEKKYGDDD